MPEKEMEGRGGRRKPGRKPLPPELKTHYTGFRVSLTDAQKKNLEDLAEVLDIRSRSGVNRGKISVRTMIALAAEHAPRIIAAIRAQQAGQQTTFFPIRITPRISLVITPERNAHVENGEAPA